MVSGGPLNEPRVRMEIYCKAFALKYGADFVHTTRGASVIPLRAHSGLCSLQNSAPLVAPIFPNSAPLSPYFVAQ